MKPILFDASETVFTTNGIGRLDAISCVVREELNGLYELDMVYPVSGPRFSDLVVSNIIFALPYDGAGGGQPFRIYKVSKASGGKVTVSARHISYQLNWIPITPFNYSSLSDCLTKLRTYSVYTNPFTFSTNKTVTSGGSFDEPMPVRSCLGGVKGSVLQRYGGDYLWDKWTVNLLSRRGADNGVRIAYGKNIVDAKQETNIENTYTAVCPYYVNDDTDDVLTLPEKYISASTASNFPYLRVKAVDFSSDFDEAPTIAQLRTRANKYITDNNIGHPNVSIDVNFVALWQTEEYADIAPLERVQLGDTVRVYFSKLDIEETARVEAYEYDVLRERYNSVTIGDAASSLAKTFVNQGHIIETTADALKTDISKSTSWLTRGDGYVVAVKNTDGSWKELLFMDTPSVTTARKVLRINENGIGFSDNGVNGDYAQSWTLDGVLSLGGLNNKFGVLVLNDANGRMTAEMSNEGIWLDAYNRAGTLVSSSYVYGDGIEVADSSGNANATVAAGEVSVTDDDGESCMLTGTDLSIENVSYTTLNGYELFNGSFTFDDGTVWTIHKGVVTDIEEGSGNEQIEELWQAIQDIQDQLDERGSGGVTDTIEIDPERWVEIEVEDGLIVDVNQGPY